MADAATTVQGGQIEVVVPRAPRPSPAAADRPRPSAPAPAIPELTGADPAPTPVSELVPELAGTPELAGASELTGTEAQALNGPAEQVAAPGPDLAPESTPPNPRAQGRALTALLEQGQWNELWARLSPGAQARWGDVGALQSVWFGALGQTPRLLDEAVVEDQDGAFYSRAVTGDSGDSWLVTLRLDTAGAVEDIRVVPAD